MNALAAEAVGPAAGDAVIRKALRVLERRLRVNGPSFSSPQSVRDYLRLRIAHLEHEVFVCLFLDAQHRLIAAEEMFRARCRRRASIPARW
jgi:DNA repair protein RadC